MATAIVRAVLFFWFWARLDVMAHGDIPFLMEVNDRCRAAGLSQMSATHYVRFI